MESRILSNFLEIRCYGGGGRELRKEKFPRNIRLYRTLRYHARFFENSNNSALTVGTYGFKNKV